ncbi:MAG: hypothetical protein IJ572_03225 [Bacilli bacterium]|nr:hypothetical protein [Bacilli bacterium]
MASRKQKRKDWLKGILLIVVLFIIAGGCLYIYGYLQRPKDEIVNTTKEVDKIDSYGYTLNDNVTQYYKDEFNKLKDLTSEEDIATQVAKLFVIDLYSINYKINKYEITSTQYFYSDKQDMHRQKVLDNFYNFVEDNSYDDRKQELPEVKNVEIVKVVNSTYKLGEQEVDSYVVSLTIEYVKDLGYDKQAQVTLVKDKNNISVVSLQ